jgi:hypothetical protein
MSKWTMEHAPEKVAVPIEPQHYQQLVAELAEILYSFSCQLRTDPSATVHASTGSENSKHHDPETLNPEVMHE